ncbi:PREDICTED: disintegrin and metalloproteinase domain-containing protein 18-like, partial [Chrysochloris asiatica]|uniref:Disintegrin and metalloproteinase domain-containing protein 18-like n=1 Tax=Chrysochloris asiatica TaxID=185453 RepID=A0A9B0WJM3_CHRAS
PHSIFQTNCFYQGHAAEIPNSVVTLSACSGLRGLLQLENVSYGIEPLQSAGTYEHMIYQIGNDKIDFSPLQRTYPVKQFDDQFYRILVKSKENSSDILLKRSLKIQMILDKAMYDYMGSEVAVVAEKVVQIFGLINTMFSQFKITATLSSLELWSDKNKISTNGDAEDVLQRFLAWKQTNLVQRPYDIAYLLIYRDHPNYVGATYHGMACNPKLAAGIALYTKTTTLEAFSVVLTQLIGINLGLTYDDIYKCYCKANVCIMNPEAIHAHGVKLFSSCNLDEFKYIITRPEFECLQNQTVLKVTLQGRQMERNCGNGILEPPEQCDCGTPQTCTFPKCCDPKTCTLIGFSECGTGTCCDKKSCLLHDHGHVCRKSQDPCDFTEYCNGTSEFCVPDIKSANLEPCLNYTAYCYDGQCRSLDAQCTRLFGKFAKGADYLCVQEVNAHFDEFGNCDGKRCSAEGIFCGKIVCHWTAAHLPTVPGYDIQYTFLGGHICMSAFLRNATLRFHYDDTLVDEGSICGSNKFCDWSPGDQCKLVHNSGKKPNCDSLKKCGGHGVCNQNFNCHCDVGFAPPKCEPAPSSFGGSIDDGFWLVSDQSMPLFIQQRSAHQNNGLLISFFIFLPLLILSAIIALKWNKIKGLWNREGTVPLSSESQQAEGTSENSLSEFCQNSKLLNEMFKCKSSSVDKKL